MVMCGKATGTARWGGLADVSSVGAPISMIHRHSSTAGIRASAVETISIHVPKQETNPCWDGGHRNCFADDLTL